MNKNKEKIKLTGISKKELDKSYKKFLLALSNIEVISEEYTNNGIRNSKIK